MSDTPILVETDSGVRLHVQRRGRGVPTLFLHGFPDHGDVWTNAAAALADGLRCWMPDLRGYRHSDKPAAVEAYRADVLLADVNALVTALLAESPGTSSVNLVGHDWGGLLAWIYAGQHPERVRRMAILNAPHPIRWSEALRNDPLQRQASSYMRRLAEPQAAARLAAADFAMLDGLLHAEEGTVEPEERDRLRAGWQTPGALAAMCRWYAALFLPCDDTAADTDPLQSLTRRCRPVEVPVCVLWGERDGAFVPTVLENLAPWARRLEVHRFTNAGHWLLRADIHTRTAALSVLRDFLQPDRPSTAAVSPP